MVFKNKLFNRFWKFSSSFQLGIPVMTAIAVLIAWGTIVESKYNDATTARKMVYDSWMMWTVMCLLIYNLTIVVIDRWPWQKKHYPFITVHAGIIILILGGFVTGQYGLDGQMSVPISGQNNYISLSNHTDLVVYATFDGDRYSKIFDREVDFFNHIPSADRPYVISLGDEKFEVIDFVKYGAIQTKVKASTDALAGASVKFQLMNANVKQVQQITQSRKGKEIAFNLGPAKVILGPVGFSATRGNEIYLTPENNDEVKFTIFHKQIEKPYKVGRMKIGDVVDTGWMGLELRLLDYLPQALEEYDITRLERQSPMATSAILVRHKNNQRWLAINDLIKLFGSNSAYLMAYQNRRIDLGFQVFLNKFEVTRYLGTMKAKEYASQVSLGRVGDNLKDESKVQFKSMISMNEPLKYEGYTIYQASFQEDEMTGQPVASVFSVNKDPGRAIKYFGSIILSLGIVWLFYQRRKRATAT